MSLHVVPVTMAEANRYVNHMHRHNGPLPTARLVVGVADDTGVVHGVGIAGLPKARMLMDRRTLEVNRVCTDGTRNACSMLYGALTRAAKAIGYRRLITYTTASENGASLRASGWRYISPAGGGCWSVDRGTGHDQHDTGPKNRWEIQVGGLSPPLVWPSYPDDQPALFEIGDPGHDIPEWIR